MRRIRAIVCCGMLAAALGTTASCDGDPAPAGDGGVAVDGARPDGSPRDAYIGAPDRPLPACAADPPVARLAIATADGAAITPTPWVLITGTVRPELDGSPIERVEIDGSERGVRLDDSSGVFTRLLAGDEAGSRRHRVEAFYASGASDGPIDAALDLAAATAAPARDVAATDHTVGTWMFSWFTGDPSWRCQSPFGPPGGFETWDGSPAWARQQFLDQLDAGIDMVGLQLDTIDAGSRRWRNVANAISAAATLWQEGYAPPRIFPFVDTAIIADFYRGAHAATLDLSSDAGRTHLHGFASSFYRTAREELGPNLHDTAIARTDGRPWVALWHSRTIDGESAGVVDDLTSRLRTELGADPYWIAHPNDWRMIDGIDEITQMFGPAEHFYAAGRDPSGAETINITPGFWNPISNDHYLAREGGVHYESAWADAMAARANAHHLYIDSWNETGEGSGIFAAAPVDYGAGDTGPCGDFVNRHVESWGPTSRHYIDRTRLHGSEWNDAAELDAVVIATDVARPWRAGERRLVSVAFRNTGDRQWGADAAVQLVASDGAFVGDAATPMAAAGTEGPVEIVRGAPAVFAMLLTAPCETGAQPLVLHLVGPDGLPFGPSVDVALEVGAAP